MSLPIKTFWLLNGNIERVSAQKDMRALTVAAVCQSQEGATAHREQLVLEIGTMVKLDDDPMKAVRDEVGFEELKKMAKERVTV